MFRFAIAVTQACNLRCGYCYVDKGSARMSQDVARRAVDLFFALWPPGEKPSACFFGGEPLLELDLIHSIASSIRERSDPDGPCVDLSVVSNGTLFSPDVASLLEADDIRYCLSCDGPPAIQDRQRPFASASPTSAIVEQTIRSAVAAFGVVPVNAVYTPESCGELPDVVEYLSSLGVRRIHLNPDFSADWRPTDLASLRTSIQRIGDWYVEQYRNGDPHFIAALDAKIAVILRGGYQPLERCQMGRRELAVSPQGFIYPCERLLGKGDGSGHSIGNVWDGIDPAAVARCPAVGTTARNRECVSCGLAPYCMNWCSCSNYFTSGDYERVSPFLCSLEQTLIGTARSIITPLLEMGPNVLAHHVAGAAVFNSYFGLT